MGIIICDCKLSLPATASQIANLLDHIAHTTHDYITELDDSWEYVDKPLGAGDLDRSKYSQLVNEAQNKLIEISFDQNDLFPNVNLIIYNTQKTKILAKKSFAGLRIKSMKNIFIFLNNNLSG